MSSFSETALDSSSHRLQSLCQISKDACEILSPLVSKFYSALSDSTSKQKTDASIFTIADGLVQFLLTQYLFTDKFRSVVGEEDAKVQITSSPFTVDDLVIPEQFNEFVHAAREAIVTLAKRIDSNLYKDITVFIDPIDGTREFSTGLGEQCSICIGFSDESGKPVAGIVYRPLTSPTTYAMGAVDGMFRFTESRLNSVHPPVKGLLTSNGGISPFIASLIAELKYERVCSGGAGNKMLMLLEGKGSAYIQDRGVSRWDTSAAQAILQAHGGVLSKLTRFTVDGGLDSYSYLKSSDGITNSDLDESHPPKKTPYNSDSSSGSFKPYSNLCGLLAVANQDQVFLEQIFQAIQHARKASEPAYD